MIDSPVAAGSRGSRPRRSPRTRTGCARRPGARRSAATWTTTSAWTSVYDFASAAPAATRAAAAAATRRAPTRSARHSAAARGGAASGWKLTAGASRSPASSISKKSRLEKPIAPAISDRREHLDRVVERQDGVVEDLPRDRDLVLGVLELRLEVEEVLVRLQLGVGLGDREQAAERLAQHPLRRSGRRRALRRHRRGARLGDRVERPALVGRVPLHRLDEVRDQVVPPLQLHVDLRPGVVDPVALADEPVEEQHQVEQEQHHHDDDDQEPGHACDSRRCRARSPPRYNFKPCARS